MSEVTAQTALTSVVRRRFMLTAWPWRATAHLASTAPIAGTAAILFSCLATPWLYAYTHRDLSPAVIAVLVLVGMVLIGAFGPLIALPLAIVERARLRLVDERPVHTARRPPARNWYREAMTWRALAYALLLVALAPVVLGAVFVLLIQVVAFVLAPFLVASGSGDIALGTVHVTTVASTWPFVAIGLVELALLPYVFTVLAGAHGALTRALLHDDADDRLHAELTEVTASRARLVDVFEAERRRIERDLHDGAQQRLVSLTLQLGLAKLDTPTDSPAAHSIAAAHDQAKQLMDELRQLIHGIYPQVLNDVGLAAAIQELADRIPVPVTVDAVLPARPPDHVEAAAYFVVAEALTNVVKHSGASHATVTVRQHQDQLVVHVTDDGRGGADPERGTGLTGLADRVSAAEGRMFLSSPEGGPTLLRLELPCRSA
jgi:signal transduction histidine kinase